MSYTNGTTHYNLPLTTNNDKRDWSDTNQAFTDVDSALYGAVQGEAQAELDIDALETRMDTAEGNIATNVGNISALDTRLTTAEGTIVSQGNAINDVRSDSEDMICAYNEATATSTHAYAIGDYFIYNDVMYQAIQNIAIGDTIVPDTNCTTTNVSTELQDLETEIDGLRVKEIATVTTDGTTTWGQTLDSLLTTHLDLLSNYAYIKRVAPNNTVSFLKCTGAGVGYGSFNVLNCVSTIYTTEVQYYGGASHVTSGQIGATGYTASDYTGVVIAADNTFTLYA